MTVTQHESRAAKVTQWNLRAATTLLILGLALTVVGRSGGQTALLAGLSVLTATAPLRSLTLAWSFLSARNYRLAFLAALSVFILSLLVGYKLGLILPQHRLGVGPN